MNGSLRAFGIVLLMLCASAAQAQSYVDVWGPPVGAEAPLLDANDQTGTARTLDNLAGERGLLLIFNRSVDW